MGVAYIINETTAEIVPYQIKISDIYGEEDE